MFITIYILFFGSVGFVVAYPTIFKELHSLLDAPLENNTNKTVSFRDILEGEAVKNQKTFNTVKDDLQLTRERNAYRRQNWLKNDGNGEKAANLKRESDAKPAEQAQKVSYAVIQECLLMINLPVNTKLEELERSQLLQIINCLQGKHNLKENELSKLRPYLAIRKWIEIHEALLAPELHDPKAVLKNIDTQMDFHEAKWTKILEKKGEPIVQQLIQLLDAAKIPHNVFCRRIGGFFLVASGGIHVPSLKNYSKAEMESFLRDEFEINDEYTIKSVTEVLMKM